MAAGSLFLFSLSTPPNKQMHRTATERCDFHRHARQNIVVAVVSALPVAVGDLGR